MMTAASATMLEQLRQLLGSFGSVVVAYSGGVDSALVATVASQVLGERALACLGVSPSVPHRELQSAVALARQQGLRYRRVDTCEHLDPHYQANRSDRCYHCKGDLFRRLRAIADQEGFRVLVDGTNADDQSGDRPGMMAAAQAGVRSPLREAGIGKRAVRELARELGLEVWDKPETACLASRIPTGMEIVPELLQQVERAEDVLASLGLRQFRVRHHGSLARIEVGPEDLSRVLEQRSRIVPWLRDLGYVHVTLDLAGFRGSALDPLRGVDSGPGPNPADPAPDLDPDPDPG